MHQTTLFEPPPNISRVLCVNPVSALSFVFASEPEPPLTYVWGNLAVRVVVRYCALSLWRHDRPTPGFTEAFRAVATLIVDILVGA